MDNIYDRIDIEIFGQKLTARPIEFEMDKDENPIRPIKYETTCPNCANSIQFEVGVLMPYLVTCPNCAGKSVHISKPALTVKPQGQIIEQEKSQEEVTEDKGCPFLDPIELGVFNPVALYEIVNLG